jgi:hypothetical protein
MEVWLRELEGQSTEEAFKNAIDAGHVAVCSHCKRPFDHAPAVRPVPDVPREIYEQWWAGEYYDNPTDAVEATLNAWVSEVETVFTAL